MHAPRKIETVVEERVSLSEHASVLKFQDDKIVGYAESERNGLTVDTDYFGHDSVSSNLSGAPPTGEADTLNVGRVLIDALNSRGSSWGVAILGRDEIDCSAKCLVDPCKELRIQVIRADPTPELWKQLAINGTVRHTRKPEELAYVLSESIRRKSLKYPASVKATVTLALDATRIPAMALTVVRALAITLTQRDCVASGFRSVWVVGPTRELTYCLYE